MEVKISKDRYGGKIKGYLSAHDWLYCAGKSARETFAIGNNVEKTKHWRMQTYLG